MLIVSRPKTTLAAVLAVALIGGAAVGCTYPGAETEKPTAAEQSISSTEEGGTVPFEVLRYAQNFVDQRVANYQAEWKSQGLDYEITESNIVRLIPMNTGTARENDGLALYWLSDNLRISGLAGTEDASGQLLRIMPELKQGETDWFQDNDARGNAYLLFHWKDENGKTTWEPITTCYEDDIQAFASLLQYDNPYTAYVMETYGNQMQ